MRDLLFDLAICEAATSGPWVQEQRSGWWELPEEVDGHKRNVCNGRILVKEKSTGDLIATINRRGLQEQDVSFIVNARVGWPSAIQRALAAEIENMELKQQIKELKDRLQTSPYGDDKIDELEEAIEHLRFQLNSIKGKF